MFCNNCGAQMYGNAPFCPNCGARADAAPAAPNRQFYPPQPQSPIRPRGSSSAGPCKILTYIALALLLIAFVSSMLNVFSVSSATLTVPSSTARYIKEEFQLEKGSSSYSYDDTYYGYGYQYRDSEYGGYGYDDYYGYGYRYRDSEYGGYGYDDYYGYNYGSSGYYDDYGGSSKSDKEEVTITIDDLNSYITRQCKNKVTSDISLGLSMQEAGGTWAIILTSLLMAASMLLLVLALTGRLPGLGYLFSCGAAFLALILFVTKWIIGGFGGVVLSAVNQCFDLLKKLYSNDSSITKVQEIIDSLHVGLKLSFFGWLMFISLILASVGILVLALIQPKKNRMPR